MVDLARSARDENIQILRFVAAAIVLVTHITFYIHERIDSAVTIWHGGEAGVPIFFIISGFVIYLSGTRLSRNPEGAIQFFRRRVARVMPLYWLITTLKVVVALIAPAVVLHNHPDLLRILGSYVLFPMFNGDGEVRPLHGVAWTLLHEMLFYYVFSISLLLRQSPFVFSSITIVALWVIGHFVPAESALAHVCFSTMNLLFVVGMILASLHKQGFRLPQRVAALLLLLGISIAVTPYFRDLQHDFLGDFEAGAVLIVSALLSIQLPARSKLRMLLVKLGESSYALYMIHPILAPAVCMALARLYDHSAYPMAIMAFAICVVGGHFVFRFAENPLNRRMGMFLERVFSHQPSSQSVSKGT